MKNTTYLRYFRYLLICCVVAFLLTVKPSFAQIDPRYAPITAEEIRAAVQTIPLSSSKHYRLVSRAVNSKLLKVAYNEYSHRWVKNPGDFDTNLLHGWTGLLYYRAETENKLPTDALQKMHEESFQCLIKAQSIRLDSAMLSLVMGNYLRHETREREEAANYMRKATRLDPKNPNPHAALGDIYGIPLPKASFAPQKAEEELLKAIELDPLYAYPHMRLTGLYMDTNQLAKAKTQALAYQRLVPKNPRTDNWVQEIVNFCDHADKLSAIKTAQAKR